jgi:hypothetical protein
MVVSDTSITWFTYLNWALGVALIVGVIWFVRRYLPRLIAYMRREWDKAGPPPAQPPHQQN